MTNDVTEDFAKQYATQTINVLPIKYAKIVCVTLDAAVTMLVLPMNPVLKIDVEVSANCCQEIIPVSIF